MNSKALQSIKTLEFKVRNLALFHYSYSFLLIKINKKSIPDLPLLKIFIYIKNIEIFFKPEVKRMFGKNTHISERQKKS